VVKGPGSRDEENWTGKDLSIEGEGGVELGGSLLL
jgi:hypothetical protein